MNSIAEKDDTEYQMEVSDHLLDVFVVVAIDDLV